MKRRVRLGLVFAASVCAAAFGLAFQTPEIDALRAADPPANAVFVDSLDLTPVAATVLRRPGRGGRAGAPGATPTPPPAPVYTLGGVTYPHAVPMIRGPRPHAST